MKAELVEFLGQPSSTVAPLLLNKVLVRGGRAGRIVEVEAYEGIDDPASHAHRGPTPRNQVMFGPAGRLYVYLSYGMHHCCNVVCGPDGTASAVLIRALEPVSGHDEMFAARIRARRETDLCSGPGKLCQALGIHSGDNGAVLADPGSPVRLLDDGMAPPAHPVCTVRVGISRAEDRPLRWYVPDNPHVSRPR